MTDKDYYVVQKGETLAGISKKLYGDTSHVKAICKMNGIIGWQPDLYRTKIVTPINGKCVILRYTVSEETLKG